MIYETTLNKEAGLKNMFATALVVAGGANLNTTTGAKFISIK